MPRFQPRIRKQKARQRAEQGAAAPPQPRSGESNKLEILPEAQKAAREQRAAAKVEFQASQPKISRQKQKRLAKYIDNKLKKEEGVELLRKLASHQVDTSLLRSSRSLGAGAGTKRDRLVWRAKETRAGLHQESEEGSGDDYRIEEKKVEEVESGNEDESDAEGSTGRDENEWSGCSSDVDESNGDIPAKTSLNVGSGLKRPLQVDASGAPVIAKRQRLVAQIPDVPTKPMDSFSEDAESGEDSKSDSFSDGDSTESEAEDEATSESDDDDDEDGDDAILTAALFAVSKDERAKAAERIATRRAEASALMEEWHKEARGDESKPSHLEALKRLPAHLQKIEPRPPEELPLPASLQIPDKPVQRRSHYVHVNRPQEVQDARLKLSVVAEEQKIMEAIHNHPVVVVCGATGSGKTTQVPQFLYEAGYGSRDGPTPGLIGVTQPRRVAAVAMAKRVGEELGAISGKVSYQIRFDSTVHADTAIKFMTDGILVREVADDFSLSKYSAIVIDEAHERSVNTDILIGMVSRIVDLRRDMALKDPRVKPLKLVIMSATLRTEDFTKNPNLFRNEPPPVVEAEGRQYEVVQHFARRTQRDYLEQVYQKVVRGHRKLPPGTMLVFLTGQNEISTMSKRLKRALGAGAVEEEGSKVRVSAKDVPPEMDDFDLGEDRVDDYSRAENMEESDDENGEDEAEGFDLGDDEPGSSKAQILPLYSQLPTNEQLRVFEPPPPNTRLIILATNVAETSITIPGIRYVFDSGRAKEKKYNPETGVYSFEIGWISKASAAQRLGRAGRTGPGHCYRLYSSAIYEAFPADSEPEILSTPIESVVLQLKSMDLQHVINFPFPTPPEREKIARAERLLGYLGALDRQAKITPVGRAISLYPVSPRFAKMLAIGHQHGCIYHTIALVAALATPELYIPESTLDLREDRETEIDNSDAVYGQSSRLVDDARASRRRAYNSAHAQFAAIDPQSDALKFLSTLCAYLWTQQPNAAETPESFCNRTFLQPKRLAEAAQLYKQLLSIIALHHPGMCDARHTSALTPPTPKQIAALKQFVAAGFLDQVAIRADLAPKPPSSAPRSRRPTDIPYLTLFAAHEVRPRQYTASGEIAEADPYVYIHSSSVLAHRKAAELPPFIIYAGLQKGTPRNVAADGTPILGRTRMLPLVPATANQLRDLARGTPLLDMGKPVGKVEVLESAPGKNGRLCERRAVWVVPSLVGHAAEEGHGRQIWPLPAVKMVQIREGGGDWKEEIGGSKS